MPQSVPARQPFQLPMTAFTVTNVGPEGVVAHALDFDLVAVAGTREMATKKLRLAVKTYIEIGLSNGWVDDILFRAPDEFWQTLTPDCPVSIGEPILIDDTRKIKVFEVTAHEALARAAAC